MKKLDSREDAKARLDAKKGSSFYQQKKKQYNAMIEARNKNEQLDKYISEQNKANMDRMNSLIKNTAKVGEKLQESMG